MSRVIRVNNQLLVRMTEAEVLNATAGIQELIGERDALKEELRKERIVREQIKLFCKHLLENVRAANEAKDPEGRR